jgi:putative ABC transport system substrate-binding protein
LIDPIGNGLITSYSHPGENVTGILLTLEGLTGKLVELAVELLPRVTTLGVLINANNATANALQLKDAQTAAAAFHIELKAVAAQGLEGLDQALQTLQREGVGATIVLNDIVFMGARREIANQAIALRLPLICGVREHVEAGALISYGVDFNDSWRRSGIFVGKILHGAKARDLPVELPTKLELVINQKTANAFGLLIPPALLARADKVIE